MLKILTSLIMWLFVWRSTTKHELNANTMGKILLEKKKEREVILSLTVF